MGKTDSEETIFIYDNEYTYLCNMPAYKFSQIYNVDIRDIVLYLNKKNLVKNYYMIKSHFISKVQK